MILRIKQSLANGVLEESMTRLNWNVRKPAMWLLAALFVLLGACRPQVPPPLPPLPPDQPAYRMETVTADALNVRRSPSKHGEVLIVLQKGSTVEIAGRDGDWIQILTPRRQYGWVYGAYITGFDDIRKRRSSNDRVKSRPAVPQGAGNSGGNLKTYPAYQTETPGSEKEAPASEGTSIQGDDFQSGFEGASE